MYDAPLTVPAILLALVLLVSGIAKLMSLDTAAQAFTSLRLPGFLVRMKAPQLLPVAEIVLAILLLVAGGPFVVVVAVAALALFVAYLVVIVRALGFREPVVCSCFGKLGLGSVDRFTAVRNVILVALAALTLFDATRGDSVLSRLIDFTGGEWAWLAGVLAAVALTWLISGHRAGGDATSMTSTAPAVDEDGDYLRVPIPFVEVRTPQDQPTTLRDIASREAVLLLIVSPTCGSCHDVIAYARTWQRTVPTLRTCLVLPMAPTENVPMLDDAHDFDLLFDGSYSVARTFEVGNPSAVLLGADGKLAGGPVTGTKAVTSFMDDIADELREAGMLEDDAAIDPNDDTMPSTAAPTTDAPATDEAAPTDTTPQPTAAPSVVEPQVVFEQPAALAAGTQPADEDDLLDYVPVPTPFAMFEDASGASISLRQIGAAGPAVFLHVMPGCGPCVTVMDEAVGWQERLGDLPIYYVVTSEPQARLVVERGIAESRVLVDEMMALSQMMGLGTPSMFATGPAQELLAGPVTGSVDIIAAMEEIIVEVGIARPELAESSSAANSALDENTDSDIARIPGTGMSVPDVTIEDAAGSSVDARDALTGERTLVVFLSPGCEACHDVAARIDGWRSQLTDWHIRVMVPHAAADFAPDLYAPGVQPDLFDATLAFGEALAIETPAIVAIDADGHLLDEPARSQGECYALIRALRGAAQA